MASPGGTLKWDPKNLEIKTHSVEKTLEPLVTQVTTLVNTKGNSGKKKGRSKKAHVLSALVKKATETFIDKGEIIAKDYPDIQDDMMAAIDDCKKTGDTMYAASQEFADDPCSSMKRGAMVRAARALLSAVTRLLIIADMADVHMLLKHLRIVEESLERVRQAQDQQALNNAFRQYGKDVVGLNDIAMKRQNDLIDPARRDEMAAARNTLKKNSMMLYTASKAFLRHPDVAAAKANRDYVYKQVCDAVNSLSNTAQASGPADPHPYEGAGELAAALDEFDGRRRRDLLSRAMDDFDQKIVMDPASYNEVRTRPSLEERLESIISGAALMADSSCTRDDRRERIVAECNAVRQALQDLLTEYMNCAGGRKTKELDEAVDRMHKKTRDLRRQLRKAVVDHVSDSFLETNVPLLVLIEAAKRGNEKEVKEYAQVFREHANKLVEVANLACSMSNNEEGVKLVRLAANQIENLCPQVINAALTLAARPRSKVAQENMDVFRDQWETQVRLLTEAVDDITSIDDFLAVSEQHILEDVNKCLLARQENDADTFDRTAGAIRGRVSRVCNVVNAEMDNYEPGIYTERVREAVVLLGDQVMPAFTECVEIVVDALSQDPPKETDENELIDSSRNVYEGVRDVRRAVLMIRSPEELETDTEYEDETYETHSRSSRMTDDRELEGSQAGEFGGKSARALMRELPEEEKKKIAHQLEVFRAEKSKLDEEIAKWDDSGNDIIVLAKQMCMIMMEMTDFTRGHGPLKSTMDVINAAKRIAEAGTKMDKLARAIADQCPESQTKDDLLAYLQRIALFCHQLNIASKVKAEVQNISGELIVSGPHWASMLDSATSLITASKNLMNAVVLTVKSCYVASTKYKKAMKNHNVNSPVVLWKMKAPEKKPLVRREKPEELSAKVRKGSQKRHFSPIQALSEFSSRDTF
ncbi:catenin alpha-2-like isoform X3 [Branchiostoma floridae]|uniref:Catenin alpha-2-like isoform X3 n=1 Tax=Branchiostoma floridae TaxID=7739 RepID=A0A9J7ML40_BRAFL|nr:catenin alpha-2-like isoform X3 [Branchiostoma floridae]